jgi:Protein of unknown function (DUF3224)
VAGSAAYVAIERVSGTLAGRQGTFAFQHMGRMTRGAPELTIVVVPDSGTGGLAGLSGTLDIQIAAGGKSTVFPQPVPKKLDKLNKLIGRRVSGRYGI